MNPRIETVQPENEDQVCEILVEALADRRPVLLRGGGTKPIPSQNLLNPLALAMNGVRGVRLYEPGELVIRVGAGTKLAQVNQCLSENRQMLAFEPPDFGRLFGRPAGMTTIGGVVATAAAGPRRIRVGGVRDHVLGMRAVSGRAERFKSGGRVIKNVTGYDLCKLLTGSWGTLAAISEITLRLLPEHSVSETLMVPGLAAKPANAAMTAAMRSSADITAAAYLPASVAAKLGFADSQTLIRIEGIGCSVTARRRGLCQEIALFSGAERRHGAPSRRLWRALANVDPFAENTDAALWRISVPPKAAAEFTGLLEDCMSFAYYFDWAGGLIWLVPDGAAPEQGGEEDGLEEARQIRRLATSLGGYACLFRKGVKHPANVHNFPPLNGPEKALHQRIKNGFDPLNILNPAYQLF